jgi:periplasmic divalent cation tolerance protein
MERAVLVYTTYPSIVEAEQAGRALVERRLCACVNILPGMISYYRWHGAKLCSLDQRVGPRLMTSG